MAAAAAAGGLGGHPGLTPLPARRLAASASSAVARSFLLCCAAAAAAVSENQSAPLHPPSNIRGHLSVNSCHWNVSWSPVERMSGCDIEYHSYLRVDGAKAMGSERWDPEPFRSLLVPLGQEVVFNVGTVCDNLKTEYSKEYANISLPSSGKPGTGARSIRCTWHYTIKKMECSWQHGENASRNTVYNLTYWFNGRTNFCTNYTKAGNVFHCTFDFNYIYSIKEMGVSIQSSSGDIQPVCLIKRSDEKVFLKKLSPPSITYIKSTEKGVFLNWSAPGNSHGICYQVEDNNSPNIKEYENSQTSAQISVQPKARHSFRVRALASLDCQSTDSEWSEWSETKELDERDTTFSLLLCIFILLFVAFLTIIVLVYLKSIKLVFLPTIPDPEKFLKHMLEDQSEDFQKYPKLEEPGKEEQQTHLLEFL